MPTTHSELFNPSFTIAFLISSLCSFTDTEFGQKNFIGVPLDFREF